MDALCLQHVQNNGSVFMHVVFAKAGHTLDPKDPDYDEAVVFGRSVSE